MCWLELRVLNEDFPSSHGRAEGGAFENCSTLPWLVWLTGLSAHLQTKGSSVQFLVRAHAWVAGQVPS